MKYITTTLCGENIGGQFCRFITAKYLSCLYGLCYAHKSLQYEDFLGFGDEELKFESLPQTLTVVDLPSFDFRTKDKQINLDEIFKIDNALYVLTCYSFFPAPFEYEFAFGQELKKIYEKKRQFPSNFSSNSKIKISVIIRRAEISQNPLFKTAKRWRWVPIEWYVSVLQQLRLMFNDNIDVQIYSDANTEKDINELSLLSIGAIHLKNECPQQPLMALNAMIDSQIIVCGLTGFCWVGGLLSNGVKILPPNPANEIYFSTGPGWIQTDNNGRFELCL